MSPLKPPFGVNFPDEEASRVEVLFEAPLNVQYPEYGARGDGSTNDTAALAAAHAALPDGGTVLYPPGHYRTTSPLRLTNGQRLEGTGSSQRWRADNPVKISYSGTEAALKIQPAIGTNNESVDIAGVTFDGSACTGDVDGLLLDGSATPGDVYIEGVLVERATFANFPRHQVYMVGQVFDITFRRANLINPDRGADHLVRCDVANGSTSPSQLTFDDCWLAQYSLGKWCFCDEGATFTTVRFTNGTVAPYARGAGVGAHGIMKLGGGLSILGTHIEGLGTDLTDQIGVAYSGVLGATILPSYCGLLGTGVIVGNILGAPSQKARGALIGGSIGGNAIDIQVLAGGSRRGTVILGGGEAGDTPPIVQDLRLSTDGFAEVVNLSAPLTAIPALALQGFQGDGYLQGREQAVAVDAPAANHGRLYFDDNGSGKTRLMARFATGSAQQVAIEP